MLGRKTYTHEELDNAKSKIARQLAAYRRLAAAVGSSGDRDASAALAEFEPLFCDAMALSLDRYFVHRIRAVSGKDGNPLNELELLTEALMDGGAFRGNNVIKLVPAETVLHLEPGQRIELSAAQFEALAKAFLGEIASRFVTA